MLKYFMSTNNPTCLIISEDDYTPLLEVELMFTVGATRMCTTISVIEDDLVEENEFFTVSITRTDAGLGEITSTQVTIEDNDGKLMTVCLHSVTIAL